MARPRIIPDADVFATIRRLLAEGGDKAVGFGPVGRATGLAAPTLVQRYGSQRAMVDAALLAAWDALDRAIQTADAETPQTAKGIAALLKRLDAQPVPACNSAAQRARAASWRRQVELALARRMGSAESAALLFAAWQGRSAWAGLGGKGFSLKDAIRSLT